MELGRRARYVSAVIAVFLLALTWWAAPRGVAQGPGAPGNSQTGSAVTESVLAIVGTSNAPLLDAPNGNELRTLAAGTVLSAVGRSADSTWVVATADDGTAGWIMVSHVVMFGVQQLPVMVDIDVNMDVHGDSDGEPGAEGAEQGAPAVSLPTVTPTPLPTATPTPTSTPTPAPTPTFTPTSTPTAVPEIVAQGGTRTLEANAAPATAMRGIVAVVRGGGSTLRSAPDGAAGAPLMTGTALTAVGRASEGEWLFAVTGAGDAGWVAQADVVVFNVETLPVIENGAPLLEGLPTQEATGAQVGTLPTPTPVGEVADRVGMADAMTARVTLTASRLNIRAGPSTEYAIVGKAEPNDIYNLLGRNADGAWLQIETPDLPGGFGWVSAEFMAVSGELMELPVASEIAESDTPAMIAPAPVSPPAAPPAGIVPTQTTVPRSVPQAAMATNVAGLSGRLVFHGTPGGAIYIYEFATGALRELTGGFDPAISPDGSTVAFTRLGGEAGLYLIDIDGRNERRIFSGADTPRGPSWSPDGRWIVFSHVTGGEQCRDVGFGICLPDNPFLSDFSLVTRRHFGLSRVDVNGENFRDLPALNSAQAPDWTGNGILHQTASGIELTRDEPDADTENLIQSPFEGSPKWQPRSANGEWGDQIVFHRRQGNHWQIFVTRPNGDGMMALTRPETTLVDELPSNINPVWSPDGRTIAFLSNRAPGPAGTGPWRIWVMEADGSNQRPLPIEAPMVVGFGIDQMLSWGP